METVRHPSLDRQLLLVVGAPRSGTTWLTRMLAAHPQVASMNAELRVLSSYLGPLLVAYDTEEENLLAGRWRQGLPLLFSREEFEEGLRNGLGRVYDRILEHKPAATHILDKHPGYAKHLPQIHRVLPGTKVVHIIRDGRDVAVSALSAQRRRGFGPDTIEGAALKWTRNVSMARKHGALSGPDRYMEVRYEQLRKDPLVELERIHAFAGLSVDRQRLDELVHEHHITNKQVSSGDATLNTLRDIPGAIWRERLTARERLVYEHISGDLLRELGYHEPYWWAVSPAERIRLALYPPWRRLQRACRAWCKAWKEPWWTP